MVKPWVSVILPTYNRAHLLPRAIRSVLAQSFHDFELIVVDDGSTDATQAVVCGFGDHRIIYLPPQENLGDSGARNRGIAIARGEWLAFQDSDDEWLPSKLERQLAFAQRYPAADLVGGSSVRIAGDNFAPHSWPLVNNADEEGGKVEVAQWVRSGIANLQTILFRRSVLQALGGFDTNFKAIGDSDAVFRLIDTRPASLVAIRACVALLYETRGSLITDDNRVRHDLQRLLLRHTTLLRKHGMALCEFRYRLALSELACSDIRASRRTLVSAIAAWPRYWRPWAQLGLSLIGIRGVRKIRHLSQTVRSRIHRG